MKRQELVGFRYTRNGKLLFIIGGICGILFSVAFALPDWAVAQLRDAEPRKNAFDSKARESLSLLTRIQDIENVLSQLVVCNKQMEVQSFSSSEIKRLESATAKLNDNALKLDSFPVLIYTSGTNLEQAKKDSGKNYEFALEATPSGSTWTHPRPFGSKIHGAWIINERPDRGGSGLGAVRPTWNENKVSLGLSSVPNKGVIEGRLFVVYSGG